AIRRSLWPCAQWPALYSGPGLLPVAPVLAFLLLAGNLMNGATVDWPYLPLINPLELGAGFALLAVLSGWRLLTRFWSPLLQQAQPWAPLAW
ncbi:hypothetical protein J8J07_21200, partial [Mycobacterium tuberculosis]|nr:hypothetical protein [Mycobacterium tuberculosis]